MICAMSCFDLMCSPLAMNQVNKPKATIFLPSSGCKHLFRLKVLLLIEGTQTGTLIAMAMSQQPGRERNAAADAGE